MNLCIAADSLFELCCVVEKLPLHSALCVILINTEKKRVKLNGRHKKERILKCGRVGFVVFQGGEHHILCTDGRVSLVCSKGNNNSQC